MKNLSCIVLTLLCCGLFPIGCASPVQSTEPQLYFRGTRSTQGGTWAAFELVNPNPHPIWIQGFGADDPLEHWQQQRADGEWIVAPGPISATGAEPAVVPPRSSVWINKRVYPDAEVNTFRLGVREMLEGGRHFSDGTDMIWSTPMRLPAKRPAP